MLVAYSPCGCLASAVLESKEYGWTLRYEERESVEAAPCPQHAIVRDEASR